MHRREKRNKNEKLRYSQKKRQFRKNPNVPLFIQTFADNSYLTVALCSYLHSRTKERAFLSLWYFTHFLLVSKRMSWKQKQNQNQNSLFQQFASSLKVISLRQDIYNFDYIDISWGPIDLLQNKIIRFVWNREKVETNFSEFFCFCFSHKQTQILIHVESGLATHTFFRSWYVAYKKIRSNRRPVILNCYQQQQQQTREKEESKKRVQKIKFEIFSSSNDTIDLLSVGSVTRGLHACCLFLKTLGVQVDIFVLLLNFEFELPSFKKLVRALVLEQNVTLKLERDSIENTSFCCSCCSSASISSRSTTSKSATQQKEQEEQELLDFYRNEKKKREAQLKKQLAKQFWLV